MDNPTIKKGPEEKAPVTGLETGDLDLFEKKEKLEQGLEQKKEKITKIVKDKIRNTGIKIYTNSEVSKINETGDGYEVLGGNNKVETEKVLVAAGREPNTDVLKVENSGIETDKRGWIKVNKYLETTKKNIWAFGDCIGKEMFTHVSREEANSAWHNANHKNRQEFDYSVVPRAIFGRPQIASVGLGEKEAIKEYGKDEILIGKANYSEVAKGIALGEEGFAKAIVNREGKILGFHIIGPYAPLLIQEVADVMAGGGGVENILATMHIHPSLSELVQRTFGKLRPLR